MAKGKKKSKPQPAVRRAPLPSKLAPGEMTPSPAPSFADQTKKTQGAIESRMAQAGRDAYGHPIKMQDAINTRIKYVEDAISRSGNGVPAGIGWYDQHQQEVRDITKRANEKATTPVSAGRVANATGPLSIRNNPRSEVRAARSAGWIASHPDETVDVTGHMSEAVAGISKGKVDVPEGTHRIGHLSGAQVAMLGRAETEVVRTRGGTRALDRAVTSATLDSSGRLAAAKAVDLARGANFDEVIKDGPKIHNYVAQTHLADPKESAYNREVFWRRANDTSVDAEGTKWQQGHLFSAAEVSGFNPADSANISVEDYIGHAMSAEVASQTGKKGATARKAQDIAVPKKGKAGKLPADMSPSEMAHAFHEHATRKAAEHFAHTSFTNDGDVTEAPTAGIGIQPVTWTEWQTQHNAPAEPKQPRVKKQPTLF
jgi:hypothetical protein